MRIVFPLLALIGCYTCAWLLHARVSEAGQKPLSLTVSPLVGFAPLDLVVVVRILPLHEDRIVILVFDTGGYATGTERQVNGEDGPKYFRIDWKGVGPGETDIRAFLGYDKTHIRAQATQRVVVAER